MMQRLCLAVVLAAPLFSQSAAEWKEQVRAAERAFAGTMAARDHAAFQRFLSAETVFFSGSAVLRGPAAVGAAWKHYYEGAAAPFSWEPEQVEVLDSGTLAMTSGPVWNPAHQRIGTFHSVWRREPDGKWRIVFDKGCPPCNCGQ